MQIPLDAARSFLDPGTRQPRSADAKAAPRSGKAYRYLCLATDLARLGRYAEAEPLALEVARSSGTFLPSALDLLARIYAQQGRYLDAESFWQRALSVSPGNSQYRRGLDAILRERGHPRGLGILRVLLLAILVAAFLVGGYLVWDRLERRIDDLQRQVSGGLMNVAK